MTNDNLVSTSNIMGKIRDAFSSKNTEELGRLLAILSSQESERWITLLYLNGIIPDPKNRDFSKIVAILLEALQISLKDTTFNPENVHTLIVPLVTMHLCFTRIREKLEEANVWSSIGAEVIYRTAVYLQDQFDISMNGIEDKVQKLGYYSFDNMLENDVPAILGGPNANRIATFEENCENMQLILSYTLWKYKSSFLGDISNCKSPYHDEEFTKLILLATIWRRYEYLWENFIYLGWRPIKVKGADNVEVYLPKDINEYLRFETAGIRTQDIMFGRSIGGQEIKFPKVTNDIRKIVSNIKLPNLGDMWDGNLDVKILRDWYSQAIHSHFHINEIYRHHFDELLSELMLGETPNQIEWHTYWKIIVAIRLVCEIINSASNSQENIPVAGNELKKVVIINKSVLADLLSSTTDLEISLCLKALTVLIFNPSRKYVEIWDTPLIEIDHQKILLVPALILVGNPARAIENALALWNPNLVQKRGKILEKRLLQFIKQRKIKAQGPITFSDSANKVVECDLIIYWDECLLLVEAKCTKAIYNAADMFRGRKHIEDAVEQLNIRKRAILENWNNFRTAANHLSLPINVIDSEKIRMIAVTNVLDFTGWKTNQVVVTDEFCFKRFFANPDIEVFTESSEGIEFEGTIAKIRNNLTPTPKEFLEYLEDPPQVKWVRESFSLKPIIFPQLDETDPKIAMLYADYQIENHPGIKAIKSKFGEGKKSKRKRHRKKRGT